MSAYKYTQGAEIAGLIVIENRKRQIFVECKSCNKKFTIDVASIRRKELLKHIGCVDCVTRRTDENYIYEQAMSDYSKKAKDRGLSFNINFETFKDLVSRKCHYCSAEPFSSRFSKEPWHYKVKINGIDRKNNKRGYEYDNCVTCCGICNRAKSSLSYEDFMIYINRIRNLSG